MMTKSKNVTLRRVDINKLLSNMTLDSYLGRLCCPICRHAQKRKEAYDGIRRHENGCAVARVERYLEYDYV